MSCHGNGNAKFSIAKDKVKPEKVKVKSELLVLYTNADGISNKMDELKIRLQDYPSEIVGICESKLNKEIGDEEFPCNYSIIRQDRDPCDGGGGVCIMIRDDLMYRCRTDLNEIDTGIIEHTWCEINSIDNAENIVIGIVYRPPDCKAHDDDKLFDLIQQIENKTSKKQLLVMGDFNFREINWKIGEAKENSENSRFLQSINDSYWTQNILEMTRFRANQTPSLLDLVFTRSLGEVGDINYEPSLGKSDHLVLKFPVLMEQLQRMTKVSIKIDCDKADFKQIRSELKKIKWEDEFKDTSVNECYRVFLNIYKDIVNKYVPVKKILKSHKQKLPWLNTEVKKAIRERYKQWIKWRDHKSEENWKKYQIMRNKACKTKRMAKLTVEEKVILKIKTDKKQFYNFVKSKTKRKTGIGAVQTEDGSLTTNDIETADILNRAFQSVFTKPQHTGRRKSVSNCKSDQVAFTPITVEEIRIAIKKLKEGRAAGPDDISNTFILRCEDDILEPLHIIFNKSLEIGEVPDMWRKANVTPIHKTGVKSVSLNYRPVSLTSNVCKIMERIVKDKLTTELNDKNWFTDAQHGFRSRRSTTSNLIEFYDIATKNLDKENSVDIFFFDLAKAFDMVPHDRLLNKLRDSSKDTYIVNWIEDYLKERKQRVVIRGAESTWLDVYSGVPQGSVIGPLLFLIYVNDIPDEIKSNLNMFADDTKMMSVVNSEANIRGVEKDLEKLEEWTVRNRMKFNVGKCSVMHCGSKNEKHEYRLYGQEIRKSECEKDLGVLINADMKFKDQVSAAIKKANRTLGLIKRNFEFINREAFEVLYGVLVRPKLEYAIQLWSPYQVGQKDNIERTQRRATKLVKSIKNRSYQERLRYLNLMTTQERRDRGDSIMTYNILNNNLDLGKYKLVMSKEQRTRGHSLKLEVSRSRTEIRRNFFTNRIVNRWNKLRQETVNRTSTDAFKKAYDQDIPLTYGCST